MCGRFFFREEGGEGEPGVPRNDDGEYADPFSETSLTPPPPPSLHHSHCHHSMIVCQADVFKGTSLL